MDKIVGDSLIFSKRIAIAFFIERPVFRYKALGGILCIVISYKPPRALSAAPGAIAQRHSLYEAL